MHLSIKGNYSNNDAVINNYILPTLVMKKGERDRSQILLKKTSQKGWGLPPPTLSPFFNLPGSAPVYALSEDVFASKLGKG